MNTGLFRCAALGRVSLRVRWMDFESAASAVPPLRRLNGIYLIEEFTAR